MFTFSSAHVFVWPNSQHWSKNNNKNSEVLRLASRAFLVLNAITWGKYKPKNVCNDSNVAKGGQEHATDVISADE